MGICKYDQFVLNVKRFLVDNGQLSVILYFKYLGGVIVSLKKLKERSDSTGHNHPQ